MLENFFRLSEHDTTVRREILAGVTTFLTMAYIIFVNPEMLSQAGMDKGAVFTATCLAALIGTAVMGLYANYPVALAPGMGLNAYFTYVVVLGSGYTWQVGLGAVFISGTIFLTLSILPVREWIINAIPNSMKMAISAGIGLFLAIIGLKNAGIVVANPATFVTLGNLTSPTVLLSCLGFIMMAVLSARKIPGGIIISILAVTLIGMASGLSHFVGIFAMPPSVMPTLLHMDIMGALNIGLLTIVFAFLFVDLFDTAGTLVGVAHRAGLLDKDGKLPRLNRALIADSTATLAGAALGTSTTTSYIESAAGIDAGGRTGLTAVTVAALFALALFLSPLAHSIPGFATAPALVFVASLMVRGLAEIDWNDITEAAPALVTAITMPLTFSIANGIGLGFITYAAIKLFSGKAKEAGPAIFVLALAFIVKFAYVGG
ncbi:NCS2 family permease [Varunaivibrio sulfuroxidans]|uniref:AGZA family xanthine/uracil permease-like MFS transporter n=1 Tax=Varunaivibrio sulfuroxidans TaxID=1773489 RepID=A0A4R3JEC3_9PROT|nr:NCS2 family permease [Varunaivibrio sulfuroxidans]TCS64144.1 AGZA family xanthine/uracil permease-like MFS transporter [Varunaivibrio sulfuroxidans]WES31409.1 NCS2 family permease [Varunaivibrio sulfuroxidans]